MNKERTLSPVEQLLKEHGLLEATAENTLHLSRDRASYAMYLPEHEMVWTGTTRGLRALMGRLERWKRSTAQTKQWAQGMHALLGESRNVRLFFHPTLFLNGKFNFALQQMDALIGRKPLERDGPVNVWKVQLKGDPKYRLISNRIGQTGPMILSGFLSYAKAQCTANHATHDMRFRLWCREHERDLHDTSRFKIELLTGCENAEQAMQFMNGFVAQHNPKLSLNIIHRVR